MRFTALNSRPVRIRHIEKCIKEFEENISRRHSDKGLLLALLLNHCTRNGVSFELTYIAGGGYYVRKVADLRLPVDLGEQVELRSKELVSKWYKDKNDYAWPTPDELTKDIVELVLKFRKDS